MLVCGQSDDTLATHLIAPSFETPAISEAHVLICRAASIGLVRLAQETARARGFGTLAFVIHARFYTRSTKLSTTFFSPAFSKAMVSLLPSIFTTLP